MTSSNKLNSCNTIIIYRLDQCTYTVRHQRALFDTKHMWDYQQMGYCTLLFMYSVSSCLHTNTWCISIKEMTSSDKLNMYTCWHKVSTLSSKPIRILHVFIAEVSSYIHDIIKPRVTSRDKLMTSFNNMWRQE